MEQAGGFRKQRLNLLNNFPMKNLKYIVAFFVLMSMFSCDVLYNPVLNSDKMDNLKLGMSKEEFTKLMGKTYRVSSSYLDEKGNEITTLSFRDVYSSTTDYYLFTFKNDKLEKWDREIIPNNNIEVKQD